MTWASLVTGLSKPAGRAVTIEWYTYLPSVQESHFIQTESTNLAKQYNSDLVIIRAPVHNTYTVTKKIPVRGKPGRTRTVKSQTPAPAHFTLKLRDTVSKLRRGGHVYTNVVTDGLDRETGDPLYRVTGLSKVDGEKILSNPELWDAPWGSKAKGICEKRMRVYV